jgi:tetratricopeptide (TPR) repeat protein
LARALAGRLTPALADCNEALRLQPGSPDAFEARGFVYLKLGQPDRAIADYDAALRVDPRSPRSLYGRGLAKRQGGNVTESEVDIIGVKSIKSAAAEFARVDPRP